MGRPKRPYNGVEQIEPLKTPWLKEYCPGKPGVREEQRWNTSTHWSYKTPNGQYDPLTYLHVLGVLMNIQPDFELRSKNLVMYLERTVPQFAWDAITVGKVLMDLAEEFDNKLGQKQGLLERYYDYKGNLFVVHHNQDIAVLAMALYEELRLMAEAEIALRDSGRKSGRLESPLIECSSLRMGFIDPNE